MEDNAIPAAPAENTTAATSTRVERKGGGKKLLVIIVLLLLVLCCCLPVVGFILFGYLQSGDQCLWKGPFSSVESGACATSTEESTLNTQNNNNNAGNNNVTPPVDNNGNNNQGNDNGNSGSFLNLGTTFEVSVDNVVRRGDDVEIEMSIKNISTLPQSFSTVLYLNLESELTDSYSQNFFSSRYQEADVQLDSEIAAGATKRGVVVYKVDDNPSTLKLTVSEGLFSDEYIEFNIL